MVKNGERLWNVSMANGTVIGGFPTRGDVYAIARRVPGVIITAVQAYSFVEAPVPTPEEIAARKPRRKRKAKAAAPVAPEEIPATP